MYEVNLQRSTLTLRVMIINFTDISNAENVTYLYVPYANAFPCWRLLYA